MKIALVTLNSELSCYLGLKLLWVPIALGARCSHKMTFLGPSRSCWNGTSSALQQFEITSKGTRVLCTINKSAHTRKVWKLSKLSSYLVTLGNVLPRVHLALGACC